MERNRRTVVAFGLCWAAAGILAAVRAELPEPGTPHPLDPVLKIAREGLVQIDAKVQDYTCTIIKRERIQGQLGETQFLAAKIRHGRQDSSGKVPFSIYLKFVKPQSLAGREVIWVEGQNDSKLVAHEAGLLNIKRAWLDPKGYLAMIGQRYPIYEIGVRNLIEELVKKGEHQRKYGECEVKMTDGAKVNGRVCRLIQVVHPVKRPHFEFHKVHIFIDDELDIPIRYACWTWPVKPGDEPVLEEEYTYTDVKLNVGLSDEDFNPDNPQYNFPSL